MSNYTIAVNWSGKDALSDSDAAKVISGTDFNTEFTTIRTAVNSKADLNGDSGEDFAMNNGTIAGNVTAPTQSAGNNSTRLATTAFVATAVAAVDQATINAHAYPVGSIYTSVVSTNPATLLGVGTWTAFGEGKVMVGIDSSDTDFDTVLETGGSKTDSHTLTVAEIPSHDHDLYTRGSGGDDITSVSAATQAGPINTDTNSVRPVGGGGAHTHDIVQPYIVVYMWRRTA
jgi:hypothetical protein